MEGLEKGLEFHGTRTLQAVETLTTAQAEQGVKLLAVAEDTQELTLRLSALEGKVRQIESTAGSANSTHDGERTPALIMGGVARRHTRCGCLGQG